MPKCDAHITTTLSPLFDHCQQIIIYSFDIIINLEWIKPQ